ncbi:hypothetical protein EB796_018205 [Bugula neritina]|uniref:Uncharacterized protein n=1 Tax=Bugula neritina TaxID=10212 RepID=A0A7J7JBV9_BUGNE|nr:hypothetical protein EB796_018205 [Bugula neritina]
MRTYVDNTYVDNTYVDNTYVDNTYVDNTYVDNTYVDNTYVDNASINSIQFYSSDPWLYFDSFFLNVNNHIFFTFTFNFLKTKYKCFPTFF